MGALNIDERLTNRMSSGVSKSISLKNIADKWWSRGVSIWAKRSSKYSLTPLNQIIVRAGRIERVGGGEIRVSSSGQDWGDSNRSSSLSRLVNMVRQVTIASGG